MKKQSNITVKKGNAFFLWTFSIWFAGEIIQYTTLDILAGLDVSLIVRAISYVVLFLLLIQIVFFQDYSWREFITMVVISAIVILSALCSSEYILMSLWLFVIAAKTTKFEDIVKRAYWILLVMIPLVILCNGFGIFPSYNIYRNGILRYSLGFAHPNTLGERVFQLIACHIYIHQKRVRPADFLLILLSCVFVFIVPNSQTAFICILVLLVCLTINYICSMFGTVISHIYKNSLIILSALLNFLSVFWSLSGVKTGTIVSAIDTFLSNRFSTCHKVFQVYGVSVWGKHLNTGIGSDMSSRLSERLWLDNGYMALLLRYGIIVYLLFSLVFIVAMIFCKRIHQDITLMILFTFSVYGIMENGIFMLSHNTFLLIFAVMMNRKFRNPSETRIYTETRTHTEAIVEPQI